MSKSYFFVERIEKGDVFVELLKTASAVPERCEVCLEAEREHWYTLSEYDRNRRAEAYIMLCEVDEDGNPDWDTGGDIVLYLKGGR